MLCQWGFCAAGTARRGAGRWAGERTASAGRGRAGIAHAEAFARNTGNEGAAACCAVERDIADDDVLSRLKRAGPIRKNDQPAAGKPLSEIVVAVALERKRHALRQKRTE